MKNNLASNLIFLSNPMNESHYKLKEVTQNVLALAIEQAQHIGVELVMNGTKAIIAASYYAKVYDVDINTAYTALKIAADDLFKAEYRWKEKNEKGQYVYYRSRFVERIGYLDGFGAIEFVLTQETRKHIFDLQKSGFTWYELQQMAKCGKYGKRLYAMFCQWRSTGKFQVSTEDLRGIFFGENNENEYPLMHNFKARVLDNAMQEVLEVTDIAKANYLQIKQGRNIVAFEFNFAFKPTATKLSVPKKKSENKERDANTVDMFDNLTDAERQIADSKLAYADQQGITDPAHRKNLVKHGIERHRQAQQAELERKAQADAQAKAKAQAELERQQAEQAKKAEQDAEHQEWLASIRWNEYVEQFDALDDEQQAIIMQAFHDEIARTDPAKAKLIKSHHAIAKRMNQSLATIAIAIDEQQQFVWVIKEQLDMHGW